MSADAPPVEAQDGPDPEIDRLWAQEASDRLVAHRNGELPAKDLSDIVSKYQQ
jgi:Putative addiction module component